MNTAAPTVTQRWRERRDSYRPVGETIDTSIHAVDVIDRNTARSFVVEHHYSGSFPSNRLNVGLFCGRALVGVAVFSVPATQASIPARTGGLPAAAGVELGRFVLLDRVPANAESWFLARAFRFVRSELPEVRAVVSYSDPHPRLTAEGRVIMPGHLGIIYRAFNGRFVGTTREAHDSPWARRSRTAPALPLQDPQRRTRRRVRLRSAPRAGRAEASTVRGPSRPRDAGADRGTVPRREASGVSRLRVGFRQAGPARPPAGAPVPAPRGSQRVNAEAVRRRGIHAHPRMKHPHDPSAPVRMDTLSRGVEFTAAFGGHYTYERPDGASSGVHHVLGRDGRHTMFAGCAEVTLGWHPRGWMEAQVPTVGSPHLAATASTEPVTHDPEVLLAAMREAAAEIEAHKAAMIDGLRALPQPGPEESVEAVFLMAPTDLGGGFVLLASSATTDALTRGLPSSSASSALEPTGIRVVTTSALPLPAAPTTAQETARDDDAPASTP